MRTTFAAILATTIVLGGCAEQRQREAMEAQQKAITDAGQRLNAARLACNAQFPDSNAQKADCKTQAEDAIMGVYYPYGDLMTLFQAQRTAIAVRLDNHEISRDDANIQTAQAFSAMSQETRRRKNEEAMVAAQRQSANAEAVRAVAPLMMKPLMQPIPPMPGPQWQPVPVQQSPASTVQTVPQPLQMHCESLMEGFVDCYQR